MESLIAFAVREDRRKRLEIRVNFGVFAGREAMLAEIEALGAELQAELGTIEIVSEHRYEFGAGVEAEVHQVRIEVPDERVPLDEYGAGELAGRLVSIADRWAQACIADRRVEISEP